VLVSSNVANENGRYGMGVGRLAWVIANSTVRVEGGTALAA
jgi:hypothetical protein